MATEDGCGGEKAGETADGISCGYCLRSLDEMEDARMLPCNHTFCMQCLSQDYRTKGCPYCG